MNHCELTAQLRAATPAGILRGGQARMAQRGYGKPGAMMAAAAILSAGLGGCINIAAPDQPIVIELNINIRQEVIYRLAEDAANTIDENADIF
ncbi:YnbE-like lipoprotein [Erythrobacter sanguineus]|uniref:YnbE-like lipoprotein n=2 Tax=Erythrobacter sanguineus TaxID=198312 RepID=A0A1M7SHQ1_9SPHN|nr:YnbE-like lipoprotein [Erythrobacter sanguineus]